MAELNCKILEVGKRKNNFNEVVLGFNKTQAIDEARRCPQCHDPVCQKACPLGIDIRGFIRFLREGNVDDALVRIKDKNMLPEICGRVCSAPCEKACILNEEGSPIAIRMLERFVDDSGKVKAAKKIHNPHAKKIAVVGSGPAGLSAAALLKQKGYCITVFEACSFAGGVLRRGIPSFRMPNKVVDSAIGALKSLGIEFKTDHLLGYGLTIDDLLAQKYEAILLALGTASPMLMDIPGENLGSVYYVEEFLKKINIDGEYYPKKGASLKVGNNVAVIGDDYAALDAARAAVRFGKKVHLIFAHTEEDIRVHPKDLEYAQEEGVEIEALTKPLAILPGQNDFVGGLKCIRMDFAHAEGDESEWQIKPVPKSEFVLDVETVVLAEGHRPNNMLKRAFPNLKLNKDGTIIVKDQNMVTSIKKVFACGDVVSGESGIADVLDSGKKVAEFIDQFLSFS